MSNVTTGDLAWLMDPRGPWPVVIVGDCVPAGTPVVVVFTDGIVSKPHRSARLAWWIQFREPHLWGKRYGRKMYSSYFPVDDCYLKKIAGLDFTVDAQTMHELFSPVPVNAEERAAVRERKEQAGKTIPRRKATNKDE